MPFWHGVLISTEKIYFYMILQMSSNKKLLFDSFISPNKFYKTMQWGLTEQYKVQEDYK
jgi:hypothetical protein